MFNVHLSSGGKTKSIFLALAGPGAAKRPAPSWSRRGLYGRRQVSFECRPAVFGPGLWLRGRQPERRLDSQVESAEAEAPFPGPEDLEFSCEVDRSDRSRVSRDRQELLPEVWELPSYRRRQGQRELQFLQTCRRLWV